MLDFLKSILSPNGVAFEESAGFVRGSCGDGGLSSPFAPEYRDSIMRVLSGYSASIMWVSC